MTINADEKEEQGITIVIRLPSPQGSNKVNTYGVARGAPGIGVKPCSGVARFLLKVVLLLCRTFPLFLRLNL
ncbi:hypothetical protein TIFTF001_042124 [Ficus carica]|uniref:Uncharacterized protein n=2 Tax=Ficus carica TaxID=3494 RepID=A0AA87ZDA6_FICCA|nr:hypothetical protein TIFTF001_042124 [Ficus carica]